MRLTLGEALAGGFGVALPDRPSLRHHLAHLIAHQTVPRAAGHLVGPTGCLAGRLHPAVRPDLVAGLAAPVAGFAQIALEAGGRLHRLNLVDPEVFPPSLPWLADLRLGCHPRHCLGRRACFQASGSAVPCALAPRPCALLPSIAEFHPSSAEADLA